MLKNSDINMLILVLRNHQKRNEKLYGYNERVANSNKKLQDKLIRMYNSGRIREMI